MQATLPNISYPVATDRPFDAPAAELVRALEARNWRVPGVTVEFYTARTKLSERTYVYMIEGDDFQLRFTLNGSSNQLTEIAIPGQRLSVYDDNSGPTYYVYVGTDWEQDKGTFLRSSLMHARLDGQPKTYLKYKGACDCARFSYQHTHTRKEAPVLIGDDDLGRDYAAEDGDVKQYRTRTVFESFATWLRQTLIPRILVTPAADSRINMFSDDPRPYPVCLGPLYQFGEWRDVERLRSPKPEFGLGEYKSTYWQFNKSSNKYEPYYSGYNGGEKFGVGIVTNGALPEQPDHGWLFDQPEPRTTGQYLLRVTPNRANGIFIEDGEALLKKRAELFEEIAPRERMTDRELHQTYAALRATRIPLDTYDGSYTRPIVSIHRSLDADEVEAVSGPWPTYQLVTVLKQAGPEISDALERVVQAAIARDGSYRNEALRTVLDHEVRRTAQLVEQNDANVTVFNGLRNLLIGLGGSSWIERAVHQAAYAEIEHRTVFK